MNKKQLIASWVMVIKKGLENKRDIIQVISIFLQSIALLFAVIAIIVSWCYGQMQINQMRKIEENKRFLATESLIYELEQNKNWVGQFITDYEKGAHSGRKLADQVILYTWAWNPPQLVNYENYLVIACNGDKELAIKIINLYSRLESCKVIVHFIHELIINNAEAKIIIEYNEKLKNFCEEIRNYFDEPIGKLKFIAKHGSADTALIDDVGGLKLIPSGTGAYNQIFIEGKRRRGQNEKAVSERPN